MMEHILPIICALVYTVGVLFVKRAVAEGAGVMRMFFLTNIFSFLVFIPVIFFVDERLELEGWSWALLTSTAEFFGAMFMLAGIRVGDVSVQTPLMGIKVIFVALFTILITGVAIPFTWWVGAGLAFVAILILGLPDLFKRSISMLSIVYVVLGCLFFGLADVLIQENASKYGGSPFILLTFGFLAVQSLVMIPFFTKGLWEIPRRTWRWVFAGSGLMAVQLVGLFLIITYYGKATVVNILYSSRGIWSIVAIWVVGHWFANKEQGYGKSVLFRRLVGASLLCLAIVIVLGGE